MTALRVVDSDTHVDECEATWAHVPDAASRPRAGSFDDTERTT